MNSFLLYIKKKSGVLKWYFQKLSGVLIILFLIYPNYFFTLFYLAVSLHSYFGLKSILEDYVHSLVIFQFSLFFLKVLLFFIIKDIFVLI
uniref:Succinate dehydrogenase subunit 4 n=1 Tax=Gloeochaete wittrockiana TaxID=38269 RepID=A0A096Y6T6_9EUKA|nr:succinate dehydrogenase subunit 4 [Gloeochaete wittrockiana]AIM52034.1 succinate dehydrogenase subunit 4 [Gloeochaete wittrockiana]